MGAGRGPRNRCLRGVGFPSGGTRFWNQRHTHSHTETHTLTQTHRHAYKGMYVDTHIKDTHTCLDTYIHLQREKENTFGTMATIGASQGRAYRCPSHYTFDFPVGLKVFKIKNWDRSKSEPQIWQNQTRRSRRHAWVIKPQGREAIPGKGRTVVTSGREGTGLGSVLFFNLAGRGFTLIKP